MCLLVPCSYNAPSQLSLLSGVWMPSSRDLKLIFEHPLLQLGKEGRLLKIIHQQNQVPLFIIGIFFLVFLKYLIIVKKWFILTKQLVSKPNKGSTFY